MDIILIKTIAIYRNNLKRFGDRNPSVVSHAQNLLKDIENSLEREREIKKQNKTYTFEKVKLLLADYWKFGSENGIIDKRIHYPGPKNFKLLF